MYECIYICISMYVCISLPVCHSQRSDSGSMAAQEPTRRSLVSLLVVCLVSLTAAADVYPVPHCMQTLDTDGLQVTCSGVNNIPAGLPRNIRTLKLVNLTATVLDDGALSHLPLLTNLDLSGNAITHLRSGAFRGLSRLIRLNLAHNELCYGDEAFPADVFQHVTSLRVLIMHSNKCTNGHVGYPDSALGELTSLETLTMNGIPDVPLGPRFARMTSLKSLEFSGKYCKLGTVSKKTFASLEITNVTQLSLRSCNVTNLVSDAFTPLSGLMSLNLACNDLIGLEAATKAVGESTSTSLDTVVLDDVSKSSVILNTRLFDSLPFRTVRRLSLRSNDVVAIDIRALSLVPVLRSIAIGFNYVYSTGAFLPRENRQTVLRNVMANVQLEVVDVSHLLSTRSKYQRLFCKPDHVDFDEYFRRKPILQDVDYTRHPELAKSKGKHNSLIPASLQVIYLDHSVYNSYRFSLPKMNMPYYNEMVVLNFSNTDMDVIKGPLIGLDNLQLLDFRRCRIYKINTGALQRLGQLKYLFLQHNVIGERGDGIGDQFRGLHSLLELDLSDNKIPSISRDAFRDLTNIRMLNLRGNNLNVLGFSVRYLTSAITIDVSYNHLTYGASGFVEDGGVLENKTQINLTNNVFVCNCSSADFVRWLQKTRAYLTDKMDLRCVNESGHVVIMADIDTLPDPCPVATHRGLAVAVAVTACCLFVVVFLVVAVAVWVYRRRRYATKNVGYNLYDGKITI